MTTRQVFFTLAGARSGTLYLRDLFRRNIPDCACRHEPFFDWGNPTLFGPAIYDAYAGRIDRIRARLARKRAYIARLAEPIYLESSHAFLKSAHIAAAEFFPEMRLIHLIRDPLLVAASEAYRESWRRRVHAPFHFYTGEDGRRHFCWALTGNEPIFRHFAGLRLSLFQWYFIQWIEIENRAMQFLDRHGMHDRCFTLHSPADLNEAGRIQAMFDFFGLRTAEPRVVLGRPRNQSIGYRTALTPDHEPECAAVVERMPECYLEVFTRDPYRQFDWSARLRQGRTSAAVGHIR